MCVCITYGQREREREREERRGEEKKRNICTFIACNGLCCVRCFLKVIKYKIEI